MAVSHKVPLGRVTPFLLGPNTQLCNVFSNTFGMRSSLAVGRKGTCLNKTTGSSTSSLLLVGIQPLGWSGQRPESSQATGMALVYKTHKTRESFVQSLNKHFTEDYSNPISFSLLPWTYWKGSDSDKVTMCWTCQRIVRKREYMQNIDWETC